MKDEDLIGKITRWDVIKFDGRNPEIACYLITGMDENGRLEGVCIHSDPRMNGRVRKGMDPVRVRKCLASPVIPFGRTLH